MNIRSLPPKLQETAEKELNEDCKVLIEDLQHIQEWIDKQPHLNARKEPQFLLSFLRSSQSNLQRTKEKLDYFYTMKTLTSEVFLNRDPFHSTVQDILGTGGLVAVTKSTAQAGVPTVALVRWKAFNPEKHHILDIIKVGLMHLDVLLNEDDNFVINGIITIDDMQDLPLGYFKQFTPHLCQKIILFVENVYPLRHKGYYFINAPAVCDVLVNMLKPFLNERFKSLLKGFREDAIEQLYDYIPQEVFPEEYGGKAGPISKINGEFRDKLEKYRYWFIDDERYGSDESKRPGKPKTTAEMFGVEDSFRQLSID